MTPELKKKIVKFVAAGIAALLIAKAETQINVRADKYFDGKDKKDN